MRGRSRIVRLPYSRPSALTSDKARRSVFQIAHVLKQLSIECNIETGLFVRGGVAQKISVCGEQSYSTAADGSQQNSEPRADEG